MGNIVTTWAGRTYEVTDFGSIGSLSWETEWPYGCTKASWQLQVPRNFSQTNGLRVGADVAIYDGPVLTWGGYLAEVEPDDGAWTFHALGYYNLADRFLALDAAEAPTSVPGTAVTQAIARGWNVTVAPGTVLSTSAYSSTEETVEFNTVRALLDAYAASIGARWGVNERRELWVGTDPTTPRWHLDNLDAIRATADEEYVTDLYGRYVSILTDGEPSDWGVVSADGTATGNLRREQGIDLTGLGLQTSSAAQEQVDNRLALAGTRYGYTRGLNIGYGDLTVEGGAPVRLGQVKAGEMLRAYNVADVAGQVALGVAQDVIIGRTQYEDGATTLQVAPVDLTPRQLSTILAAPQAPRDEFEGTPAA